LEDESLERLLKSFIDEKSLIKLLRILEDENTGKKALKIDNKFRKIVQTDMQNYFYN
jgi:hypothetical protein